MAEPNDNVSQSCWDEWISKKAVANAGVVVVNHDKEVLVLKRKKGGNKDLWELPSGGINKGEKPQYAAARELKEETAIEFDAKLLEELVTVWADKDKTDIVITFLAYPVDTERVRLGNEHSEFDWLPLQKYYNSSLYPMNEGTKKQIEAARTRIFHRRPSIIP